MSKKRQYFTWTELLEIGRLCGVEITKSKVSSHVIKKGDENLRSLKIATLFGMYSRDKIVYIISKLSNRHITREVIEEHIDCVMNSSQYADNLNKIVK